MFAEGFMLASSHAIKFAKEMLDGTATAFYEVDNDLNLANFLLCGVPTEFHHQYLGGMNRFDPLHVRRAADKSVARLGHEIERDPTFDTATYQSFSEGFGISDVLEFYFRRDAKIVAGLSVVWDRRCKIPDGVVHVAQKMHRYIEFNLVDSKSTPTETMSRYGLTSRERDVARLLCCGRTNREISELLTISLATVKTHLIHIFEKLGVENRSAVVALMSRLQ
jgi:DNA-binding CsgD family transcriptional regulator